jgi:hypothetical protein
MKKPHLLKWLCANVFNLIGGLMIGFGFPIGKPIMSTPLDFYYLCVPGIILVGISVYYQFINTDWKNN